MKEHLILFLKGIGIGVANIIPGVSGGTMAVIFGVYEKLTTIISDFLPASFKKKKEYLIFLIPLALGMGAGIIAFANIVKYSIANYPKITAGVFTLLILPSIPLIIKGEDKKKSDNIFFFILGIILTSIFIFLDYKYGTKNGSASANINITLGYCIKLFICGSIAAGAMIIPGISGSLLLLIIGEYYNILKFISSMNIKPLFFFGIGVAVGLIVISKLITILLNKYRSRTLFFITGLVIASLVQIWMKL